VAVAAAEDGDVGAYVVAEDGAEPAGLVPAGAPTWADDDGGAVAGLRCLPTYPP
jgi:hypothetical protein